MGGAYTHCLTKRLEINPKDKDQTIDLKLTCPNGKRARIVQSEDHFDNKDAFKAGVMALGIESRTFCSNELIWKEHSKKTAQNPTGIQDCEPFFDEHQIHHQLTKCKNMLEQDGICTLNLAKKDGAYTFLKKDKDGKAAPSVCTQDGVFFIQYACELEEKINER